MVAVALVAVEVGHADLEAQVIELGLFHLYLCVLISLLGQRIELLESMIKRLEVLTLSQPFSSSLQQSSLPNIILSASDDFIQFVVFSCDIEGVFDEQEGAIIGGVLACSSEMIRGTVETLCQLLQRLGAKSNELVVFGLREWVVESHRDETLILDLVLPSVL